MSFDLGFFARHKNTDRESVKGAYEELMKNGSIEWNGNKQFELFKHELFLTYPELTKDASDDEFESAVWSCDNLVGEGYLHVSIRNGQAGDGVAELIDSLLKKYDVVLCDPQGGENDCIVIKPQISYLEKILKFINKF